MQSPDFQTINSRLELVEREYTFFKEKLQENNENIKERLDRVDKNICDVSDQLRSISSQVSENKGVIETRRRFWLATSSCIGILVGMGIHEPIFKLLGIK